MLLTHLIFFRFFTGAGASAAPAAAEPLPAGVGNWKWDKAKTPKKRKTLRFSDFENRDELERLLKESVRVIPMSAVDDSDIILADEDEDEDDMLILAAAMKILQ